MPTLNTKLLLRVVGVLAAFVAGLIALHEVQAGRIPEAILWQANDAAEKGRTDKAIYFLKQYLEFRPNDYDMAIKLGDLMAERAVTPKDLSNALFLYERVLREAPERTEVARKLIALYIRMGRHADALAHAERLFQQAPADGMLLAQIAECQAAQNRPTEARQSFEKAIALSPENVEAFDHYARLLVRHFNQPLEARAVLDRMVQANPGQCEAFLVRARFAKSEDRADDCMRDLDRVFLLDPENGEALVMSAEILQARGEILRAKEALRDVIATYPRFSHGYRALSWLELLTGNRADARMTLERGVAMLPDAPELLTPLADIWIEEGEFDRVEQAIEKMEVRKDSAPRVSYLRGRLLMKRKKWNDAVVLLESLRADTVALPGLAPQLNLLIASCQERRGDSNGQIEALRRALAADPNHLGARVALANAYLNAGRLDESLKEYQSAARSSLAGLGVKLTAFSLRMAAARQGNASADEWKAIGTALSKLREENRSAVEPVVLLAELSAGQGDFATAIKTLREETAARPGDPRLWSALAATIDRGQGTLAAAEAIAEGQLAAGESIELRLARARVWADDFLPGRAQRLARLEELSPAAGDTERARLFGELAAIHAAIHDDAGQRRALAGLGAINRQDLDVRETLYALALKSDSEAERSRWRAEIQRLEGNGARSVAVLDALHQIATATANDRRLARWLDLGRAVVAESPDQVDARILLAAVAELRGELESAVKELEIAIALEPAALRCQEARLGFLLRNGRDETARNCILRLEADPRLTPLMFRGIVEGAIRQGGPESQAKCIALLAGHFQREPRSAIWAGHLLESQGKVTEAIALYRQANQQRPAFADAWSARLIASARLGKTEVDETIAQAAKTLDRKTLLMVCAECGPFVKSRIQDWTPPIASSEDRRLYAQACVTACEARGRLEDAIPVLTAVAEAKDGSPEDAAWAKRTLAAIQAALGSAEQKRDAIANLKDGTQPKSIADVRSRIAALLVAYRTVGGDDRRIVLGELIEQLERIVRDESATSKDWFQLAQLFRVAGNRAGCRKCLDELMKREPKNLFYVAVNVDDLLLDGRLDESRPLVARLEDGVADIRVVGAAARFHTLDNDPRVVLELVERFVRVADPGTTDGITRQRQAAELLDQLTRIAAGRGLSGSKTLLEGACERYRASFRAYPEAVTTMAALLAFGCQVDAAFDELEKQKSRLSALSLSTAGVAILRSGNASPRQFQAVKSWIDDGLTAEPGSLPLQLNLAELHALRQDFAIAEQIYRDVLKADPKNLVALNNLAWILAPRVDSAQQALRFAERAIELYGATAEILDTRARILISAGQYDRAIADLRDAINQGATPLRYFHLALAQMKMSKMDEAIQTFREARARSLDPKTIHPSDLPAYKVLADRAGG
jgi:cellulose synthase operon protein C